MLEVLRGRELSDVLVVVTRWFGGVLLGAGGLVRAYSDAVRAGLDEAAVCRRRLLQTYEVPVPHAEAGRLEHALRAHDVTVLGVDYQAQARMHLAVPADQGQRLPRLLAELSGGEITATPTGTGWVDQAVG
jgi:putative IMPACT (imprinted ancient) family translation regulator